MSANDDPNFALKNVLAALEQERLKIHPTTEAFKEARLKYAFFLEKDHLNFYLNKANKYKPGTIRYNINMAKYNELIQEIADNRKEAEAGRTLRELEIIETMKQNIEQCEAEKREAEARIVYLNGLKAKSNEELKQIAGCGAIAWGNNFLSWPERHKGKDTARDIITIMKDRGFDIVPELNAKVS